ncbi:MAG: O-antigen ligase family protein [bacterium]
MKNIINKKTWIILSIILGIEALSFLGNSFNLINLTVFAILILGTLVLSLKDLKYGILIVLFELFIGSMGYLFSWSVNEEQLSLRIGLWLVIMAIWIFKEIQYLIVKKKIDLQFSKSKYWKYYLIFFIVIAFAFFNGFVHQHGFGNIFLDGNNWIYLLLIFPVYRSLDLAGIKQVIHLLSAAAIWLSAKTMFILFVSSHKITWGDGLFFEIAYKWIRDTRIGEITMTEFGFYRIFFQSHIFVLLALFIIMMLLVQTKQNWKNILGSLGMVGLFLATIITSMSRSIWLGLGIGLLAWLIIIIMRKTKASQIMISLGLIILSFVISIGFILAIVKFPVPEPLGADALSALTKRTQGGDSALSSRWNLLPPLWKEIRVAPLHGQGFGATVTYQTDDPRIAKETTDGQYTTYAFEWGWLDSWLEFGLIGLAIYIFLYCYLIYTAIKKQLYKQGILIPALIIGLVVLIAVNIFTPYLNHPLGLGYLILATIIIDSYGREKRFA